MWKLNNQILSHLVIDTPPLSDQFPAIYHLPFLNFFLHYVCSKCSNLNSHSANSLVAGPHPQKSRQQQKQATSAIKLTSSFPNT